jgi:hypothetical protein
MDAYVSMEQETSGNRRCMHLGGRVKSTRTSIMYQPNLLRRRLMSEHPNMQSGFLASYVIGFLRATSRRRCDMDTT